MCSEDLGIGRLTFVSTFSSTTASFFGSLAAALPLAGGGALPFGAFLPPNKIR